MVDGMQLIFQGILHCKADFWMVLKGKLFFSKPFNYDLNLNGPSGSQTIVNGVWSIP